MSTKLTIGDIVTITDGSWSLSYKGKGQLTHEYVSMSDGRDHWRVIGVDWKLPMENDSHRDDQSLCNDTILVNTNDARHLVFAKAEWCGLVSRPCPDLIIHIPGGTKTVNIVTTDGSKPEVIVIN